MLSPRLYVTYGRVRQLLTKASPRSPPSYPTASSANSPLCIRFLAQRSREVISVPLADVERVVLELYETDAICSAVCSHCGAVNTFPGWSAIEAFVCSECGEGVRVTNPVQ